MRVTEKELIEGCIRENSSYQRELYRRYAGKMLVVAKRYARHHMEAEDIVQDAFIKVFDNIAKFAGKGSFEGWIRRIVSIQHSKNKTEKAFETNKSALSTRRKEPLQPEAYADLNAEELLSMISRLPDGYRLVFNLYAIEGYSHREIADLLGIQESTSRSQLVKARKMLQDFVLRMQKLTA